jgi:hypothetical protein
VLFGIFGMHLTTQLWLQVDCVARVNYACQIAEVNQGARNRLSHSRNFDKKLARIPGLPDLCWYNLPKREKYAKKATNIYQTVIKYTYQLPVKKTKC